jgi:hypothetical protein
MEAAAKRKARLIATERPRAGNSRYDASKSKGWHFRLMCCYPLRERRCVAPSGTVIRFETEVYVDTNDITGAVNVLPLSRPYRERLRRY